MQNKKVYINTFGCQMNVYDTGRMFEMLAGENYEPTDSYWRADLVILNTCAIREKAVQKVYSFLGCMTGIKRRKPNMILAVTGCVAQQQSEKLSARFEGVNLVLGTHAIHRLPEYLRRIEQGETRLIDVEMTTDIDAAETGSVPLQQADLSSFVTIMRGCDNFCTYCVVPYVRGRENSRKPERIIEEIRNLVAAGAREVTLLGQNVNSYGIKEGLCRFPELLERVHAIDGLQRIRFVTSHPKDLSDDLIDAFGRLDKLCNHIHLPVQSGSNRMLKRMNRKYTRELYMEQVARLREVRPEIAITTDFIAGFPGETVEDFEQTLDLIAQVRFDTLFAFAYSDRPEAPASRFDEKVDSDEKNRRLRALLDFQAQITRQVYDSLVGRTYQVLVEGLSKRGAQQDSSDRSVAVEFSGRSSENRIINFVSETGDVINEDNLYGRLVPIRVERACANSLWGRYTPDLSEKVQIEGGQIHAA